MNKFLTVIAAIAFTILLVVLLFVVVQYQYEIYKKKHGEHMTVTDFLFDSERK